MNAKAADLADDFAMARAVNLGLLERLPAGGVGPRRPSRRAGRGVDPVTSVATYAGHDRIHLAQIETIRTGLFPKAGKKRATRKSRPEDGAEEGREAALIIPAWRGPPSVRSAPPPERRGATRRRRKETGGTAARGRNAGPRSRGGAARWARRSSSASRALARKPASGAPAASPKSSASDIPVPVYGSMTPAASPTQRTSPATAPCGPRWTGSETSDGPGTGVSAFEIGRERRAFARRAGRAASRSRGARPARRAAWRAPRG